MENKNKDIFLSEFWSFIHEAKANGLQSPFSEEAITFVEENLMAEPVLTDTAKALLYYLQEKEEENKNFTLASDCAKFLHTTGYSLIAPFKSLVAQGLAVHSYVGKKKVSGYSLTKKGEKYNPLGKDKDINDIILSIIE